VLLPFQLAVLESYAAVRDLLVAGGVDVLVTDVGEEAFPGVSQRVGVFSLCRAAGDPSITFRGVSGTNIAAQQSFSASEPDDDVITWLSGLPRFPREAFKDPGVHTGNVSKKIILKRNDDLDPMLQPVREGKDIVAFHCGPPRLWVDIDPHLDEGEYCRIGKAETYLTTPILLRQTAGRPIAARHTAPAYFRNSVLACQGLPGLSDWVTVGILNSRLIGYWYQRTVLDSAQRAFPQVKIGALRELPAPRLETIEQSLIAELEGVVSHLEEGAGSGPPDLARLEELVCRLYGVPEDLRNALLSQVDSKETAAS